MGPSRLSRSDRGSPYAHQWLTGEWGGVRITAGAHHQHKPRRRHPGSQCGNVFIPRPISPPRHLNSSTTEAYPRPEHRVYSVIGLIAAEARRLPARAGGPPRLAGEMLVLGRAALVSGLAPRSHD